MTELSSERERLKSVWGWPKVGLNRSKVGLKWIEVKGSGDARVEGKQRSSIAFETASGRGGKEVVVFKVAQSF